MNGDFWAKLLLAMLLVLLVVAQISFSLMQADQGVGIGWTP